MVYSAVSSYCRRLVRVLSVFCEGDYTFFPTLLIAFSFLTVTKIILVLFDPIYDVFNFTTYMINITNSLCMGSSMALVFFAFWSCSRKAYGIFRIAIRLFILQYSFVLIVFFLSVVGFIDMTSSKIEPLPNPNIPVRRK